MSTVDFGAAFTLEGANKAIQQMRQLDQRYGKLSQTIDKDSKKIGGSFRGMWGGLAKGLATLGGATTTLTALKAATVGSLTAMSMKVADSREELTGLYHDLRALGKTSEDLKLIESRMMDYTDQYSGMSTAKAVEGVYKIASATSDLDTATQATLVTTTALMSKLTKLSAEEGAEYLTKWLGKYRSFIKGDIVQATQEFAAQTAAVVNLANTDGRQLLQGMEESLAVLSQFGWSSKQQLAMVGAMTEAFKGAPVDTMLQNMAMRAGKGYGKLMAMLDKRWQDPDELTGKAKSTALRTNKKLMKEYAGIGAELWANDPIRYLNEVAERLPELKKRDKNWLQSIASEGYEQETANKLMAMLGKRKRFAEILAKLDGVTWEGAKQRAKATDKDLSARKNILRNRIKNFRDTLALVTEPTTNRIRDWIGEQFIGGRHEIQKHLTEMQAAVGSFANNMWKSFKKAFTVNPEFSAWLSKIVEMLRSPDAEKWGQMGRAIGKMAGTNLTQLIEAFNLLRGAASGVWKVLGPVVKAVAWIGKTSLKGWADFSKNFDDIIAEADPAINAYKWYANKASGAIDRTLARHPGLEKYVHGEQFHPQVARRKMQPTPGNTQRPSMTSMMREDIARRRAQMGAAAQEGQPINITIHQKNEVDGKVVDERIKRYNAERRDARGFTFGEGFPG